MKVNHSTRDVAIVFHLLRTHRWQQQHEFTAQDNYTPVTRPRLPVHHRDCRHHLNPALSALCDGAAMIPKVDYLL